MDGLPGKVLASLDFFDSENDNNLTSMKANLLIFTSGVGVIHIQWLRFDSIVFFQAIFQL